MKTRFLKVRMQNEDYARLKVRAAEAGKPLSTFANTLLEAENSFANTEIKLADIKSQLQELAAMLAITNIKTNDHRIDDYLHEVLLIVRELAIERNAQILTRVTFQLNSISNQGEKR